MTRVRRPSAQTLAVLHALSADADRWRYGYELCTELGLKAGSIYPILIRLAQRGLLDTGWEATPAPGRPPRHLYRLTDAGCEYALAHSEPAPRRTSTARPQFGSAPCSS